MEAFHSWIENGADVNYKNHLGFTALMGSAKRGDLKMVQLLVQHGAHISLKDNNHYCALHYATSENQLDVIKYLIENGAIVNDGIYMTAIHKEFKEIHQYFDSLDESKKIFIEKPNDYTEVKNRLRKGKE
jgi:ankyrin repeat protein